MEQQRINLVFPKDLTKLAGNSFGTQIFIDQVKNKIDYNKECIIVFPNQIDRIATSFIQGFFDDILQHIGLSGIKEQIFFESSITDLKKFVLENLD